MDPIIEPHAVIDALYKEANSNRENTSLLSSFGEKHHFEKLLSEPAFIDRLPFLSTVGIFFIITLDLCMD
jgi:hypothetical protein